MTRERIVGGLLVRFNGRLFATSVRHERAWCPSCWRCGSQIFLDTAQLVPGDEDAHPYVWCCPGCKSDSDDAAMEAPEGRGVRLT
jgi:hypothetical protein